MLNMQNIRRVVVKVGTSTLTYPSGKLNIRCIERLVRCISDLENRGYEMILVSSGAVSVGAAKMKLPERPKELRLKQAAAAVGQCELMHIYDKMFLEYGNNVAQILLTRHDVSQPEQKELIHNTFDALLENRIIPIVNENDTVAVDEMEFLETFGDNDTLSAEVSVLCRADLLLVFTDIDGLYDEDPRTHTDAHLIPIVHTITDELRMVAGGAGSKNGTGGMITKLNAAQICLDENIPMRIVNGERPEIIFEIMEGRTPGTLFMKKEN
jgi:glutamate 5-kinase